MKQYDIPKSTEQLKAKLREEFTKHPDYTDIRVIDMLVIKVKLLKTKSFCISCFNVNLYLQGQMELKETVEIWKQKGHIMAYFKDTVEPKPSDFMSKFLNGHE